MHRVAAAKNKNKISTPEEVLKTLPDFGTNRMQTMERDALKAEIVGLQKDIYFIFTLCIGKIEHGLPHQFSTGSAMRES